MSNRALVVALVGVSLALAVAIGVLLGTRLNANTHTSVGGQRTSYANTAQPTASAPSTSATVVVAPLSTAESGAAAANLACMELQASSSTDGAGDANYFVVAITIHGLDSGKITSSGRNIALDDYERQRVQTAHSKLAQATAADSRWSPLQRLVRSDENAAIARWDQGGVIGVEAINQTMGDGDIDTIRGYCAAAKTALTANAQHRHISPSALLRLAGATTDQLRVWDLWAAD